MKTLLELFLTTARANPERIAIQTENNAITFAELEKRVVHQAQALRVAGARPGDRIGLLLPNSAEFVIVYLAIALIGAMVMPLNEQYAASEVAAFVDDSQIARLVTSQEFKSLCERVETITHARFAILFVESGSSDIGAAQSDFALYLSPDSPVMLQFSSGSTGQPKRIVRTHANLVYELESLIQALGVKPTDRFIGVAPFSHVNGLMRSMLVSLCAGATLYPVRKFERHAVAELIERERITRFIGVPFMFSALAQTNLARVPDFSALRYSISASAPMPKKFNLLYREKFGGYVRQLYGSTETGTMSVNLSSDIAQTLESVGTPIRGVEFKVMTELGAIAPEGEVGEIAVSSPAAITGYEGMEELNRPVFRDGYFLTGDLGRMDRDGMLYLVGRKNFLINKGGYKIDPRQVEEILEMHPSVEEAAVVGAPTPYGDERVKAVVVLRAPCTESELVEFCRGKLSAFKIPSVIEFRTSLSKSPAGKILRHTLA